MLNYHQASTSLTTQQDQDDHLDEDNIRDIHALTPPQPPPATRGRRRDTWETGSHRSSSLSMASEGGSSENFTTMSREFSALVLAGSSMDNHPNMSDQNEGSNGSMQHPHNNNTLLSRIREDDQDVPQGEETNPLAIVPDINPFEEAAAAAPPSSSRHRGGEVAAVSTVQRVKKEEVETKINAWQNAKVAEINNRFKREDAIIHGWEDDKVQKASTKMKKVERKLEEKRAKALEKMQNEIAKARRKAEERRASAEAKRGTKVARVLEVANLMRAVGRAPAKRSFF